MRDSVTRLFAARDSVGLLVRIESVDDSGRPTSAGRWHAVVDVRLNKWAVALAALPENEWPDAERSHAHPVRSIRYAEGRWTIGIVNGDFRYVLRVPEGEAERDAAGRGLAFRACWDTAPFEALFAEVERQARALGPPRARRRRVRRGVPGRTYSRGNDDA